MKFNIRKIFKGVFLFLLTTLLHNGINAQIRIGMGDPAPKPEDTTKPAVTPRTSIKPYNQVITKEFTSQKGLFAVHRSKDKIYFEIPDSLLKRVLMVINRLNKVPALHGMYAGEQVDERTIFFEKGPDSTINIRYDLIINEADSTNAIYKAVVKSSNNPIAASFPVLAYGNHSAVIDVSRFLKDKNFVNSIDPNTVLAKNITVTTGKDYYVESIRVYPINVEIAISKTYTSTIKELPAGSPATIETNTSFIALPEKPLQRRYYDERVGYFADAFYAFADAQQKAEIKQFIIRWRLEPKPEDIAKWKSGQLVEPQKPIVIYIDPATPKQWRPYLIQGVNDWQAAFEQAGFKNAIFGKEWPENDTNMHMEDARYSMINYLPSSIANAYGPNIHDPRSGEVIQTHIGWYHDVMELVHNWYMVQAGAVDPQARHAKFDEKLMGQLIRFVSSHEVGHTMGLRHNFGSSSRTPVDSLRSKTFLAKYGHTASIMDYARFDYVAQPEDNIPQNLLFPRIGDYDKWAIEWGYKYIHAATPEDDKKAMRKLLMDKEEKNPRLWFGDGESRKFDPQCQTEDLGDNAMKASAYGIKNLQRILPNLAAWTYEEGELNQGLRNMYKQVQDQFTRYLVHVLKNVGGVTYTIRSEEEKGPMYEIVPAAKQQAALDFFNEQLFTTPYWLLDRDIVDRVSQPSGTNIVDELQIRVLNTLLDTAVINKLLANGKQFGDQAYPLNDFFTTLHKGIWAEILGKGAVKVDNYRRNLQKSYVGSLVNIITAKDPAANETDAVSLGRADLLQLQDEVSQAITRTTDPLTLYHLKDVEARIKTALNPKTL